jgi:hypothetical protein
MPSCSLPGTAGGAGRSIVPYLALLRVGFAVPSAVTRDAVRSYRTVSPLPVTGEPAHRRFTLCCTFRRLAAPGRYPAPCPAELGLSSTPEGAAILTRPPLIRPNELQCPGEDSNLHAVSGTRSLVWPVYQFQHLGIRPTYAASERSSRVSGSSFRDLPFFC